MMEYYGVKWCVSGCGSGMHAVNGACVCKPHWSSFDGIGSCRSYKSPERCSGQFVMDFGPTPWCSKECKLPNMMIEDNKEKGRWCKCKPDHVFTGSGCKDNSGTTKKCDGGYVFEFGDS